MIREKSFLWKLSRKTHIFPFSLHEFKRIGISVTFAFGELEFAAFKLDVSCWSLIMEDKCVAILSSCMKEYCIPIMAEMLIIILKWLKFVWASKNIWKLESTWGLNVKKIMPLLLSIVSVNDFSSCNQIQLSIYLGPHCCSCIHQRPFYMRPWLFLELCANLGMLLHCSEVQELMGRH